MIDNHILAAIFVHLITAILQLIAWRKTITQRYLSVGGTFLALIVAIRLFEKVYTDGTLTLNASNWEAPFGIVFVADLLAVTLVLLTSIAGFAVSIFSTTGLSRQRMMYGYFPIFHFLTPIIFHFSGCFLPWLRVFWLEIAFFYKVKNNPIG